MDKHTRFGGGFFVFGLISSLFFLALLAVNLQTDRGASPDSRVLNGVLLFWCFPLFVVSQSAPLRRLYDRISAVAEREGELASDRPLLRLFIISFAILFIETMLIRYIGSQTRIFAFYKNIPLIGAFFGLGLGCLKGKGGGREVLLFLIGMPIVALFFALAAPMFGVLLGLSATIANSERVFGFGALGAPLQSVLPILVSHLHLGLYCTAVFIALAWLFAQLGRVLAASFDGVPRLTAYSINIAGSLAGLAAFVIASVLHTSPWVWFLIGLTPLLWSFTRNDVRRIGAASIALATLIVAPSLHETVWSSYQKLTGRSVPVGYEIDISDAFYQTAVDLRPETIAALGYNPAPVYNAAFAGRGGMDRVLIVGAGSGNDVAAALRSGAKHIDAVDIDSAIIQMGRLHHPERPYDDPRVKVIIDDARAAFKKLPPHTYDAVVFGLLDSHTQLAASSVRLDNYVYTQESFSAAADLVRPGGVIVVTAVTAVDWLRDRFARMLELACGSSVQVQDFTANTVYVCTPTKADPSPSNSAVSIGGPTDDWPFPYLPERSIPLSYLIVIGMLVTSSLIWMRRSGIGILEATPLHGHMFFLGGAFLLMEVYAINRLALLFGTTWLVSAVSIAAMLIEIVAANLFVGWIKRDLRPYAYSALAALLLAGWFVGPEVVLGRGNAAGLLYALFLLSPVFCAGIVFATSFRQSPHAGAALGANILGSVLGGWTEYATMATGIRFMALIALGFYLASFIFFLLLSRKSAEPESA